MFKKFLYVSAAIAALAGTANAADLSNRIVKPAPYAAPAFSWTGLYVGVNAGGAFSNGDVHISDNVRAVLGPAATVTAVPLRNSDDASFTGGAFIGYNYQIGSIVLGGEGDINYLELKARRSGSAVGPLGGTGTIDGRSKVDWFGTARARIGFTPIDRLLVYGTGGLAFGEVKTRMNTTVVTPALPTRIWNGSQSDTKVGWALGAGAEYAVTNNILLRAEYLYVDLGKGKANASFQGVDPVQSQIVYRASRDAKFSVLRAGISYKF